VGSIFNFVAAFLLGTAVAKTIGAGLIHVDQLLYLFNDLRRMGAKTFRSPSVGVVSRPRIFAMSE
jgi:hypothetical protein